VLSQRRSSATPDAQHELPVIPGLTYHEIPKDSGKLGHMEITIQPKTGHALRLQAGDVLRVTDLDGLQDADLVAFDAADPREHLSQGFTRANNDKADLAIGDHLFSILDKPMLTVVADTVGVHDLLFPPCSSYLYRELFNIPG